MTEHNENNRVNMFYSRDSLNLDIEYSMHYVKNDLNMEFTLFRINHIKSKSNNLYGETKAKDKVFMKGVVLHGIINMSEGENKNLNGSGIRKEEVGDVMVGVFKKELDTMNVIVSAGDYIMYNPDGEKYRYFEVTNPNYVDYATNQTRIGIESLYKKFIATPVREDVILKFNE
jgi:hypothetical protein